MMNITSRLFLACAVSHFFLLGCSAPLHGVTYVNDTGGYAYEESRTAVQMAPAIALGALAIAGIIAIGSNNSHHSSSSSCAHSGSVAHYSSYDCSCYSSY